MEEKAVIEDRIPDKSESNGNDFSGSGNITTEKQKENEEVQKVGRPRREKSRKKFEEEEEQENKNIEEYDLDTEERKGRRRASARRNRREKNTEEKDEEEKNKRGRRKTGGEEKEKEKEKEKEVLTEDIKRGGKRRDSSATVPRQATTLQLRSSSNPSLPSPPSTSPGKRIDRRVGAAILSSLTNNEDKEPSNSSTGAEHSAEPDLFQNGSLDVLSSLSTYLTGGLTDDEANDEIVSESLLQLVMERRKEEQHEVKGKEKGRSKVSSRTSSRGKNRTDDSSMDVEQNEVDKRETEQKDDSSSTKAHTDPSFLFSLPTTSDSSTSSSSGSLFPSTQTSTRSATAPIIPQPIRRGNELPNPLLHLATSTYHQTFPPSPRTQKSLYHHHSNHNQQHPTHHNHNHHHHAEESDIGSYSPAGWHSNRSTDVTLQSVSIPQYGKMNFTAQPSNAAHPDVVPKLSFSGTTSGQSRLLQAVEEVVRTVEGQPEIITYAIWLFCVSSPSFSVPSSSSSSSSGSSSSSSSSSPSPLSSSSPSSSPSLPPSMGVSSSPSFSSLFHSHWKKNLTNCMSSVMTMCHAIEIVRGLGLLKMFATEIEVPNLLMDQMMTSPADFPGLTQVISSLSPLISSHYAQFVQSKQNNTNKQFFRDGDQKSYQRLSQSSSLPMSQGQSLSLHGSHSSQQHVNQSISFSPLDFRRLQQSPLSSPLSPLSPLSSPSPSPTPTPSSPRGLIRFPSDPTSSSSSSSAIGSTVGPSPIYLLFNSSASSPKSPHSQRSSICNNQPTSPDGFDMVSQQKRSSSISSGISLLSLSSPSPLSLTFSSPPSSPSASTATSPKPSRKFSSTFVQSPPSLSPSSSPCPSPSLPNSPPHQFSYISDFIGDQSAEMSFPSKKHRSSSQSDLAGICRQGSSQASGFPYTSASNMYMNPNSQSNYNPGSHLHSSSSSNSAVNSTVKFVLQQHQKQISLLQQYHEEQLLHDGSQQVVRKHKKSYHHQRKVEKMAQSKLAQGGSGSAITRGNTDSSSSGVRSALAGVLARASGSWTGGGSGKSNNSKASPVPSTASPTLRKVPKDPSSGSSSSQSAKISSEANFQTFVQGDPTKLVQNSPDVDVDGKKSQLMQVSFLVS